MSSTLTPPGGAAPAGGQAASLLGDQGGAGAPAPAADDPRTWLPEAYRTDPTFAPYKDIEGLAKSHKHAASLLGIDRNQVLRLPTAPDAPEWADVWNRLGRPPDPNGYDFQAPDGLPAEALAAFKAELHKAGLNKQQGQAVLDFYARTAAAQQEAQQAQQAGSVAAVETSLKAEWGRAYEDQMHAAKRAVREMGGAPIVELLNTSGLGNNPDVIKMFATIGTRMAEPSGLRGGSGQGGEFGGAALTPAAAQAEINRLTGDKEFAAAMLHRQNPGHAEAKKRWDNLHSFAFPTTDS